MEEEKGGVWGAWWACEDEDTEDEDQAATEETPEEVPEAAQRLTPAGPGPGPGPAAPPS